MSDYDISIKKGPIHFSTNNHGLAIAAILTLEGKVTLHGETGEYMADFRELEQQTSGQAVRAEQGPPEGFDIGQQAPDGRGGIVIGYIGGDAVVMGRRESKPMTWGRGVDWCEKFNDSSGEPGWRMPSEEELSLAWDNRDQLTGLSMGGVWYWTSTQYSADYAMIRDFSKGYKSKGYKFINHKDYDLRVRPVRRLKI